MPPPEVKDSPKGIRDSPNSTTQAKPNSKDESSSSAGDLELRLKLKNEQSDLVYTEILSHLDWDHAHQDTEPDFKPFYFFCSTELRKQKPELDQLVASLTEHRASRLVGGKGVEVGVAWEFNDIQLAKDLEMGVLMQRPMMYLGYDMVTIDGTLQPCQVVCTF